MHIPVDCCVNRPTGGPKTITLVQLDVHKFKLFWHYRKQIAVFQEIIIFMSTYDYLILFPFVVIVINQTVYGPMLTLHEDKMQLHVNRNKSDAV